MTATYNPSSNHWPNDWDLTTSIYALDRTHFAPSTGCPSSVPLAEPSRCTASVIDDFTGRALRGVPVTVVMTSTTAATRGIGVTFSPPAAISPQRPSPYACTTASDRVCRAVFRCVTLQDVGAYTLTLSFARDADHEAAPPLPPFVINVTPPTAHDVVFGVICSNASRTGSNRTSPLAVSRGDSTQCNVTVTDTHPPDSTVISQT